MYPVLLGLDDHRVRMWAMYPLESPPVHDFFHRVARDFEGSCPLPWVKMDKLLHLLRVVKFVEMARSYLRDLDLYFWFLS